MPIRMLDPTGIDEPRETRLAPRDGRLAGKRLGLLANGKTNSVRLLELVGELLVERHGVRVPVLVDKRDASRPAADAVLDELLPRCDLVVTAIGD
jgi:hypothetical protein